LEQSLGGATNNGLARDDLGEIFGIEIDGRLPVDVGAAKRSSGPVPSEGSNISAEPVPTLSKKKPTPVARSKTSNKKVRALGRIDLKKLSSRPANSTGRKRRTGLPTPEVVSALRKPARR
jgi:hypothetical protein